MGALDVLLDNNVGELLREPPYCAVFSDADRWLLAIELAPAKPLPPKVIRPTPPIAVRG